MGKYFGSQGSDSESTAVRITLKFRTCKCVVFAKLDILRAIFIKEASRLHTAAVHDTKSTTLYLDILSKHRPRQLTHARC